LGELLLYRLNKLVKLQIAIPINVKTTAIITKITIASMLIAKAFNQPQSKKCLIRASQMNRTMIVAIMPEKKNSKKDPIKVPKTTIHIASVDLAFCPPTNILPEIQRTGAKTIMRIIIEITNASKFIAISSSYLYCLKIQVLKFSITPLRN
jgi:hypothetical protein